MARANGAPRILVRRYLYIYFKINCHLEVALALLLPLVPAATAPLAPTILLPAEDGVLASSDRRAAPGGSLPSPT
eukprot:SAG31_NODE_30318_length_382_cov_6.144876_1_plen_74_part_10